MGWCENSIDWELGDLQILTHKGIHTWIIKWGLKVKGILIKSIPFASLSLTRELFTSLSLTGELFTSLSLTGELFTSLSLTGELFTSLSLTGELFTSLSLTGGTVYLAIASASEFLRKKKILMMHHLMKPLLYEIATVALSYSGR